MEFNIVIEGCRSYRNLGRYSIKYRQFYDILVTVFIRVLSRKGTDNKGVSVCVYVST